ncbi:MAG TPA: M56 family metallopeptidase [Chitinophagaceae bacterium]|nr:M56 family metallopeptidase [Chitinophagaceae bacterium]
MQVLSQSAFLQALGYAIAGSLWQAALLWLVVAGISVLFKLPSRAKYKIALAAQFGAFVWFLVSLQFYYVKCSEAIALLKYSGLNSSNAFVFHTDTYSFSSILLNVISKSEKYLPYLSVAYICLLFILAVRWMKGYRQTVLIKTQGLQKIDVQWRLFVKRISDLLNIKHPVGIYVSELVKSPLTVGFLKPLILIPLASINNLTTYQLEAVILHELAHIKRADYIINIVQSIIEISLFFNPFIQLLGKAIKRERENSCDDWVLQFQYDPSTYAEALLRIAYMQQAPAFAMNAAGKENDLLWRVKRMLNQKEKTFQYRNRLFALLLITGLLSSVAWFSPGVKTAAPKTASAAQPVVMEPLAIKIDNPLFNPLSFMNKPFKEEVSKAAEDASKDFQEAAVNITSKAVANVVPAALSRVQTISTDLPQVFTQASDAVNTAMKQLSSTELTNLVKTYTDSATLKTLVNNAASQLKTIEWANINKGMTAAGKELNKELEGKNLTVYGLDLKQIINKSFAVAQKSVANLQLSADNRDKDNSDGDDGVISSDGTITLRQHTGKTIRLTNRQSEVRQKTQELKRYVDSIKRVYGATQPKHQAIGDLGGDVAVQYNNTASGYAYNYLAPQVSAAYIPAKFDQSGNSYSWNNGNGLSVTAAANTTLIAVKEDKDDTDTFRKKLTIETMDSIGQRHTFHVTVEVYQ